ncbi:MAG: rod shape-determining protein MreD [Candidatus Omnitrophica bacterium]|nr:rod shape-determining protein MreD [Candidatus Omnitrophota bacterium]
MLGQKARRAVILSLVLIFFELFFGRVLELGMIRPDLFLIYIVFWSFVIDRRSAPLVALLLGFVRDVFSSGFFGAETFSYFAAACLISMLSLKVERTNILIQGATSFIFALFQFWIYALIVLLCSPSPEFPRNFFWLSFLHSLYTAFLAVWMIGALERCIYFRSSRAHLLA